MKTLIASILTFSCFHCFAQTPIKHGHAHNDYAHNRPLFEALENGFTSIEIDVFLYREELVVSHVKFGLRWKPSLEELYLEPLKQRMEKNNGRVFPESDESLILMIDFKTAGNATYRQLQKVLEPYKEYISIHTENGSTAAPIEILISGSKPYELVFDKDTSIATLDVGSSTAQQHPNKWQISRVSNNYKSYFDWNGKGQMPEKELEKLKSLVNEAHSQGRKIRFWRTPETTDLWRTFLDAGVDWINTDELEKFAEFWEEYQKADQ